MQHFRASQRMSVDQIDSTYIRFANFNMERLILRRRQLLRRKKRDCFRICGCRDEIVGHKTMQYEKSSKHLELYLTLSIKFYLSYLHVSRDVKCTKKKCIWRDVNFSRRFDITNLNVINFLCLSHRVYHVDPIISASTVRVNEPSELSRSGEKQLRHRHRLIRRCRLE